MRKMRKRKAMKMALTVLVVVLVLMMIGLAQNNNRIRARTYINHHPTGSSHSELVQEYKLACRDAAEEVYGTIIDDYVLCVDSEVGYGMYYYCINSKHQCIRIPVRGTADAQFDNILYGGALAEDVEVGKMKAKDGFWGYYLTNR